MAKNNSITKTSETERQEEINLLNSWHPHIKNAINHMHLKFKSDTKFILTESDLKCWLFYYLQHEKPYTHFAVHTEVTHYARHKDNDKESEKKFKFRDMSLLCPWKIKANEDFLNAGVAKKDILSKGFQHNATAIHFELKFIRENGGNDEVNKLKSDIEKLKNYSPNNLSHIRHFVIVCGSRSKGTKVADLKRAVEEKDKKESYDFFKERVRFFLFDDEKIEVL